MGFQRLKRVLGVLALLALPGGSIVLGLLCIRALRGKLERRPGKGSGS